MRTQFELFGVSSAHCRCADHITSDVQFGHAGASASAKQETAAAKNAALRAAGAHVPTSFDDLGLYVSQVYRKLVDAGSIVLESEVPPPPVPIDFAWARELGLIRKPASFITSICDERGEELLYAGELALTIFCTVNSAFNKNYVASKLNLQLFTALRLCQVYIL